MSTQTGHCTGKTKPLGRCRRFCLPHRVSMALFGRWKEVIRSWCDISISSQCHWSYTDLDRNET